MEDKKGLVWNPLSMVLGILLILAGLSTLLNAVNLGALLASLALLIELTQLIMKQGF